MIVFIKLGGRLIIRRCRRRGGIRLGEDQQRHTEKRREAKSAATQKESARDES